MSVHQRLPTPQFPPNTIARSHKPQTQRLLTEHSRTRPGGVSVGKHISRRGAAPKVVVAAAGGQTPRGELDLTEENVRRVLEEAREEFGQIFDTAAGMTGVAELAEVDGPFVKIRLKGRFWHTRSMVLARLANFLQQRIPEILEVDIEDEKQLDDSPANF